MPSPLHTDRPAAQPPRQGAVDALITRTRELRGDLEAVRREAEGEEPPEDARQRWQRALYELAVHQLDDLGDHLGQLLEGLPADTPQGPSADGPAPRPSPVEADGQRKEQEQEQGQEQGQEADSRVGSAEWDLLTDGVTWSDELFRLFGRRPEDGAPTLDELPSWVLEEDTELLTAMVTGCLVDGRPIDGEFRIVRGDGAVRTVHMMGEPTLDADGTVASMWAVLRDVTEVRRSREAVHEIRDSLLHQQRTAHTERRLAVELQEAVLPPWRGSLRFSQSSTVPGATSAPGTLDLAAHYLPSASSALIGGDWFDALQLPDGRTLLSVGGLTGHGVAATSSMAMLLGALRGMAVTGAEPGPLMGWLNHLLDASAQPALGSAVCCRYDPATLTLSWSQAGHPAPLLFGGGSGRALRPPEGMLLGAVPDAVYAQAEERLETGDMLVLHTDGLAPRSSESADAVTERLLACAPRFATARSAQECVRTVLEEFGSKEREDDACVLVARIRT
ncbi:PP2C family protein-serine/threonine phosphatase [Streptomyces sp. UNOC14_S4]|uniref:PP2C family protein-serine/threonine phosphatase n=1 Tax=Streptomyces sp. UNOC14_S4 TaxID=2872340 RepID=UPI001E341EB6|nr:PP2C family protein-serine/threonine phosphatase [Streptomyces sp. UNOC14_S4]MCC3768436.1 SpoIIE family protein phosphatase [Streptomyces sp. UNOC14_S4]